MRLLALGRLLCDGAFFRVRCCAHILNLIVQARLKLIDTAVDKIHQGVQYIHGSSIRRNKFYADAQNIFHLDIKKKLCLGFFLLQTPLTWEPPALSLLFFLLKRSYVLTCKCVGIQLLECLKMLCSIREF